MLCIISTIASAKWKFLVLDRLKIKLCNTIDNERMYFLVILTLHPEKADKVDLIKVDIKFIE